jgi:hypothetical protein
MRRVSYEAAKEDGLFPAAEAPGDARLDALIEILLKVFGAADG